MGGLPPQLEPLDPFAVLNCLPNPIRLSSVASLAVTDDLECATFDVPVTHSARSHHCRVLRVLRVLRGSGVIATTKSGTRSLHRLRRAELDEGFPGPLPSVLNGSRAAISSTTV
jgi:hypothetical protein